MKKNLTYIGIFIVLIFGLTIFNGCAEKKSVVTNSVAQEKEVAPAQTAAQTTDTSRLSDTANPNNTINSTFSTQKAAVSAIRRPRQLGQKPRRLHAKETTPLCPQSLHRTRRKP